MTKIHVISRLIKHIGTGRSILIQGWAVRLEDAKGISKLFYGKRMEACAWAVGRLLQAGGGDLIVHNKNGEVDKRWEVRWVR